MPTLIQRSFTGGILAPSLHSRVDTNKYAAGAKTIRNAKVMRHGGVESREGSEFVSELKDSTKTARFIKFIFNSSQTYTLEFGDQYMRVIKEGVQLKNAAQNITGVTNANPCVVTYAGADTYANGNEVAISSIAGALGQYLNGRNFKVASVNSGANTFQLNYLDGTPVDSSAWPAWTSGGTLEEVYEIATPYLEADLPGLQFVQSADVITIVHPSYAPRELSRTGHTSWALTTISFTPSISSPTPSGASTGYGANPETQATSWGVTAIAASGEESLMAGLAAGAEPSGGSPQDLEWDNVSGAVEYRVYRRRFNLMAFVGTTSPFQQPSLLTTAFSDTGLDADTEDNPPADDGLFASTDNYPAAVAYIQQRLFFFSSNNDPEGAWGSRIGQFSNFTYKLPNREDDRIQFNLVGRRVNRIKHALDLGMPVLFTETGVWKLEGDAGLLTPAAINPRRQSGFGCGDLPPIELGESALYVQARGSVIRDLNFAIDRDGYRGNDLTVFAAHLFDGYTIVDWDYQEIPHSVVWAVRSDGKLLGLTYIREQEIVAWHEHDTDGFVENVCVVPEGSDDIVYLIVRREIDGQTKRYIERMTQRRIDDIKDFVGMDSSLSYDGRNTDDSHTMTLSGGTAWDETETLTLTSSAAFFASTDVGNQIHMRDDDGNLVRVTITAYTSSTVVSGTPDRTVPVALRSATSNWARAVDQLTGLWHLEGKDVSILGDGAVVASPHNDRYETVTVTDGAIMLQECFAVIHVGLPYFCDLETLNIDMPQGETLSDKMKGISAVSIAVEKTRGMFIGGRPPEDDDEDPIEGLYEPKVRQYEGYDETPDLLTDTITQNIQPSWSKGGRIFIRQIDPLPMTVLSVAPTGLIPIPR